MESFTMKFTSSRSRAHVSARIHHYWACLWNVAELATLAQLFLSFPSEGIIIYLLFYPWNCQQKKKMNY